MAVPRKQLWEDYVLTSLQHTPSFLTQGAVAFQSGLKMKDGETRVRIPGLKDLETIAGNDVRVVNGSTITPQVADGFTEYAPIVHRGNAITETYTDRRETGLNTLDVYAPQIAGYNQGQLQLRIGKALAGLFDGTSGPLRTTHRLNAADDSKLTAALVTQEKAKHSALNETAGQKLKLLYVNSLVRAQLVKDGLATYTAIPAGFEMYANGEAVLTMLGNSILVDNNRICATTGNNTDGKAVYPSYLVGPNAFYIGWQNEMELDEEWTRENGKSWILQWINSYAVGVVGVSFGDVTNPTDAQIATATNWTKSGRPDAEIMVRQILTYVD